MPKDERRGHAAGDAKRWKQGWAADPPVARWRILCAGAAGHVVKEKSASGRRKWRNSIKRRAIRSLVGFRDGFVALVENDDLFI